MWKNLLKNEVLKGATQTHTFERRVYGRDRGRHNTMVSYDYSDGGDYIGIDIDWTSVVIEWSMSVEVYDDGLELNAPQVQKVSVDISYIEEIGEEKLLAENLELETTENIEVEELDRVRMGSVILPDADIEIGQKDGEFYIKKVIIQWL
jgi:hypothetical protein